MNTTVLLLAMVLVLLAILTADVLIFRLRQKEMQKHDRVLFPFCQLRRDVIRFLHVNVMVEAGSISRAEYKTTRQLLSVLDATIHNYNEYKTSMFNVRKIVKHIEMYREASETALEPPDHPEIREFHERIRRLLIEAFLVYTPLIRWELALRMVAFAYRIARQDRERRREAEYVIESAEKVRNDARRYNVGNSGVRYA